MGYELITLIAALKQRKRPNMFLWNLLVRKINPRNTERFEVHTKKAKRDMAPFVGKYVDGEVLEKEKAEIKFFEPSAIKPVVRAEANELLERGFGQTIYGQQISIADEADKQVAKELSYLDEKIVRREIWMLSQLMTTGVVPIVGKTVETALDYNCSSENFKILSGTAMFTDSASDPYEFIKQEQTRILKETGVLINTLVFESSAGTAFMNHEKIKENYKYKDSDITRIKPQQLGAGTAFLGTLPELGIDIFTYTDWVIDPVTATETLLIPEGGMIMCKSNSVEVEYGAHVQIPKQGEKRQLFTGDRIPKYYTEGDAELLRLVSKPYPNPDDVDGFACHIVK